MSNGLVSIRPWEPGDGISCSRERQAPRSVPCGPPVAVCVYGPYDRGPGWGAKVNRTFVCCANHLPGADTPGSIATAAKKAATERLIVENWDAYKRVLADETAKRVDEALSAFPEPLRDLIKATAEAAS